MKVFPSSFAPASIQRAHHKPFIRVLVASTCMACLLPEPGLAFKPRPPDPGKFYPIVVEAAIGVLPPELVESFQPHVQVIASAAAALDPGFMMKERREHYMVWLDFAAPENGDREARLEAARTFPLDRESARQTGYRAEQFGDLPFQLLDHYQLLVEAFRAAQWIDVREHVVGVLHYSTATAFPSQTTREKRDAWPHRLEIWLAERIRARLEIEVRVFPGRFERLPDARMEILGKLRESHASYFTFQDIEQQARRETGMGDRTSPYSGDFYASPMEKEFRRIFSERAGDVLCGQFKNAALLAANLIGTAWMDAGSPELPDDVFAARPEKGGSAEPGEATKANSALNERAADTAREVAGAKAGAESFIASTESQTCHRATCPHAARIKAENTIRFATFEEAERAGRKPCRACRPDGK